MKTYYVAVVCQAEYVCGVRVEVLSSLHLMITLGFSRDPTKNEIHQALYDKPIHVQFLEVSDDNNQFAVFDLPPWYPNVIAPVQ